MSNTFKTTLLLAALTGILIGAGQMVGGPNGMVVAFAFAVVMNFGSYWFSDRIVLAMYRAQPVDEASHPELMSIVRNLATRANTPMPRVFILPTPGANAFATGRNPAHAAVAVTEGLMRIMSREELEGVLAHEMAHVTNRDILISSIAATLAGALMMLANMLRWAAIFGGGSRDERDGGGGVFGLLAMTIIAPIAAMMIQMAISRSREFEADATAARMLGTGEPLARALEKLESAALRAPMEASPQTAHMFIFPPLRGSALTRLFSTHPPIEDRVARLRGRTF